MILHSKITPERPQITPTSYQSHAFGTYCLFWALAKKSSLSHSPPQPRETPHTLNGPTVTVFRFRSEKKTYQWSKLGKIEQKTIGIKVLAKNPYGQWDKTCTTRVVPFSVGEYTFWKKIGV